MDEFVSRASFEVLRPAADLEVQAEGQEGPEGGEKDQQEGAMSRTYNRGPCDLCGKDISCAGFAKTAHMRKHVREGLAVERTSRHWFGRHLDEFRTFDFTPAGVLAYRAERARREEARATEAKEGF